MTDAASEVGAPTARQLVIDFFTDTEGDQTVDQVMAGTGITSRDAAHQALHRAAEAGLIERVAVGVYRIAPVKPPAANPAAPPPPAEPPEPEVREGHTDAQWIALIERYHATRQWDQERDGLPPDQFGNKIPYGITMRLNIRREEARKAAQKIAAQKAAAAAEDAALLKQLLAATNGNYVDGPDLRDLAPIKALLETVPIEFVCSAVRGKADKRIYPKNEAVRSWRDPALLRAIAEHFTRYVLVPRMVEIWGAAPGAPAERVEAPAAGRFFTARGIGTAPAKAE